MTSNHQTGGSSISSRPGVFRKDIPGAGNVEGGEGGMFASMKAVDKAFELQKHIAGIKQAAKLAMFEELTRETAFTFRLDNGLHLEAFGGLMLRIDGMEVNFPDIMGLISGMRQAADKDGALDKDAVMEFIIAAYITVASDEKGLAYKATLNGRECVLAASRITFLNVSILFRLSTVVQAIYAKHTEKMQAEILKAQQEAEATAAPASAAAA